MEKRKEDDVVKNKASSPRLVFSLCLKTNVKQGSLQKKENMHFKEPGIKQT